MPLCSRVFDTCEQSAPVRHDNISSLRVIKTKTILLGIFLKTLHI